MADVLSWYGFESPQAFVRSRQLALKAIALDDLLAEGHASLGMGLFYSDWGKAGAEKEFLRAIQLDPNYANAHHWYGELLSVTGRHQEAILQAKRALEIEPLSLIYELLKHPGEKYVSPYWMAQIAADLGKKDEALQWLEAAWAGRAVWMVMLSVDPAFDPLRSDPRFQSFVRRIHLLQ